MKSVKPMTGFFLLKHDKNTVLVFGIQHNDLVYVYTAK